MLFSFEEKTEREKEQIKKGISHQEMKILKEIKREEKWNGRGNEEKKKRRKNKDERH